MLDRAIELKSLAERGDPWFFLCASSYLEYLAKLTYGKSTTQTDYKQFLKDYFFQVCPNYLAFRYSNGNNDLEVQMYHTLRCGIVHSFSMIADAQAVNRGGRHRSILLAHRHSGKTHLSSYVNNRHKPKVDAAIFVAEDFAEDIEKATKFVFALSRKHNAAGTTLKTNIGRWSQQHPPIMGKFK